LYSNETGWLSTIRCEFVSKTRRKILSLQQWHGNLHSLYKRLITVVGPLVNWLSMEKLLNRLSQQSLFFMKVPNQLNIYIYIYIYIELLKYSPAAAIAEWYNHPDISLLKHKSDNNL
jgi:hypothetical protein